MQHDDHSADWATAPSASASPHPASVPPTSVPAVSIDPTGTTLRDDGRPSAPRTGERRARPRASDPRSMLVAAGEMWVGAQRHLLRLALDLDRSHEWALDNARTCAHWIASALDIEISTAREWLRVGRALERFEAIAEAFDGGRISYTKVRQLTRVVEPETELDLLEIAERTPAGRLSAAIAAWMTRNEEPEETEERQHQARKLSWRVEPDGMVSLTARLTPGMAAMPIAAIDAWIMQRDRPDGGLEGASERASADASESSVGDDSGTERKRRFRWPTMAQQRADGLVALMQNGGALVDTEVVLHVRGDGCTLDDGTPITETFVEDLVPQSFIRLLIHDAERRPINASGRHRHPTTRQKRVVHERDGGCVDCGGTTLLEIDHDPDFSITRRTVVDELRDRCWRCHRERHAQQKSNRRTRTPPEWDGDEGDNS